MLLAFKQLFNYLTGSEVDLDEKCTTEKIKAESLKNFLKYLTTICRRLFPAIVSPSTFTFLALLIDVVVLEVVIYQVGLISGKYYKCLSDRDLNAFWSLTINAILYIIVNSILKSFKNFSNISFEYYLEKMFNSKFARFVFHTYEILLFTIFE